MTLRDVDGWTRFRGWRTLCWLAAGACLVTAGCTSLGTKSEQVRSAMLGMKERELVSCLGPPTDYMFGAEKSLFTYRLDLRREAFKFNETPLPSEPAFCNVAFHIDQGVISDVAVRGIDLAGMNADATCTVVVGECLAELAYTTGRWPAEALAQQPM